jgi:hypothetical protein
LIGLRFTGLSTATGRLRLVMVIGSPVGSISLRQAMHFDLNSVALMTFPFTLRA